ncbi:uncharacterized protein [Dysidea avara]|uniref:uncharacterized protein n=1 Tax=Dysidea avara TaxID=196820 RepID=UPI0033195B2B
MTDSTATACTSVPHCTGQWLPVEKAVVDDWLQKHIEEIDGLVLDVPPRDDKDEPDVDYPLHPVVKGFKEAIEANPELSMFFHQMFAEIPEEEKGKSPQNYHQMLQLMSHVLTKAPEFSPKGITVSIPMFAILRQPIVTKGGYAAFLNSTVNLHLKKILNAWGIFLKSPASCYVLTADGWLSKQALEKFGGNFEKTFKCDPNKPHYGFTSWDNFFTRELQPDARPVADPGNKKVIANACESAPLRVVKNITKRSRFWIKGQPYNLKFMLGDDPLTDKFVGGTVYQAFLSVFSYHRWHSPVDGKIVKAYVQDGTYYSDPLVEFKEGQDHPVTAVIDSQPYLSEMATRALIFIEADNPYIGLMCFMGIGMVDVSTCDIKVYEGQRVKKGQETGMFHFGGSTHCLIFRPGVKLDFDFHGQTPGDKAKDIPINSKIATVPKDVEAQKQIQFEVQVAGFNM